MESSPRYPREWEVDALLADGGLVRIRPIQGSDADRHRRFVEGLSPESRYFRFFGGVRRLSDRQVEHFCNVDYVDRFALVALVHDDIVAVARYDRGDGADAEVAFVVDDAYQGRGLGTLLLEYLGEAARVAGIARFTAEVLASNQSMLRVFRDAGYRVSEHFEGHGVIHVELPIAPTEELDQRVEAREHTAEERSIARVLDPASVAVIGASHEQGTVGYHVFLNLLQGGFNGAVYPVNPNATHVASVHTYPSILDIPGPVDLAVVVVPASAVPDVIEQCAQKGVTGAVVLSAGFAETGPDGRVLEQRLIEVARAGGMRVIGPNCIGIANTARGLNATFVPVMPPAGPIGFLSQSGALGIALLEWAANRHLGISTFVSIGNKADVSGNDLLQFWENDDATDVILLYLESFGNARKFSRLARRVSRHKPIVVVKSGRTPAGTKAAASHTAAAASSDVVVGALFRQAGVIRVDTLDQLFDIAEVLVSQPVPAGNRVAIVGNSGGPGILAADACAGAGLEVATLAADTGTALRELLGDRAAVTNPIDMVASASPAQYEAALRLVLDDPAVDAVLVIFTPPLITRADDVAEAIARAAAGATKPIITNFLASRDVPVALQGADGRRRIPSFPSPEPAAIALGRIARYGQWQRRDHGVVPVFDDIDRDAARRLVDTILDESPDGRWLTIDEATRLASFYGIAVSETARAADGDAAVRAATRVGFPVALKAQIPGGIHKTELGAVQLDLQNAEDVVDAVAVMQERLGDEIDDFVVQPTAPTGVETIVGVVQDPGFGPLIMFGIGGVTTELIADRSFRIVPVTDTDARDLVRSLRSSPLLFGYRGSPATDVDAIEELILRVALLADDLPELAELDGNPVIVSPDGAVCVDVKARVGPKGDPTLTRRAL